MSETTTTLTPLALTEAEAAYLHTKGRVTVWREMETQPPEGHWRTKPAPGIRDRRMVTIWHWFHVGNAGLKEWWPGIFSGIAPPAALLDRVWIQEPWYMDNTRRMPIEHMPYDECRTYAVIVSVEPTQRGPLWGWEMKLERREK